MKKKSVRIPSEPMMHTPSVFRFIRQGAPHNSQDLLEALGLPEEDAAYLVETNFADCTANEAEDESLHLTYGSEEETEEATA